MSQVESALGELEPIGLEELDEQAKLRRRVDAKYVVPDDIAAAAVRLLRQPGGLEGRGEERRGGLPRPRDRRSA